MSHSVNHGMIYDSMNQDYALCKQMLAKLQIEKFALEHSDANLLEQTITEKSQILKELAETQTTRDQELQNLGFTRGLLGLKALFKQNSSHASAEQLALLKSLEDILKDISRLSHINAAMIHNNMNQTNKILDVMLNRPNTTTTYSKHGFASTSNNNNTSKTKV